MAKATQFSTQYSPMEERDYIYVSTSCIVYVPVQSENLLRTNYKTLQNLLKTTHVYLHAKVYVTAHSVGGRMIKSETIYPV